MSLSVIILAAGQGTRMRSSLPKVLHPVGGLSLLEHVVAAAQGLSARDIFVVYGHGAERVLSRLRHLPVQWMEQEQQLGTGHAVAQALPRVSASDTVLILYGDVPLIKTQTLQQLVSVVGNKTLGLMTAQLEEPTGYGRIVRDQHGKVLRIVEEKDASPEQRKIKEINTGILAAPAQGLQRWVAALKNKNAQGEYYLTDVIAMAAEEGVEIRTVSPSSNMEIMGVNNKAQLAQLERAHQSQQAQRLMEQGVTLRDPARLDVRGEVQAGRDVTIDVNVILEGKVIIGDDVSIGPNNVLRDVVIGDGVKILANCVIEEAGIGAGSRVGPFARVRPETQLAEEVHVGNFVEVKKSAIGKGSKVNHLSYVGDATIGKGVNVGAGTITCNYDGANKYRTIIEDNAFIGSDTQLVAPVTVGAGATIGAGSTITRDAPPGELTLSRAPQRTREGWKRPVKKPKE